MAEHPRNILICSCEDTIPLDAEAVKRGCRGATVSTAQQLCRAELDKFRAAAASDAPLTIGPLLPAGPDELLLEQAARVAAKTADVMPSEKNRAG